MTAAISVEAARRDGDGMRCMVHVQSRSYDVGVSDATAQQLAPQVGVEELVRESFVFLLEREPAESIMSRFDLPVIARYFPEYPREISRRLHRAGA